MTNDFVQKILRIFVTAMTFMCLFVIQGMQIREAHQYMFMLGAMVLFGLLLKNIWLTLFLWWSVFLFSYFKFGQGWNYLANVFYGCILFYIVKVAFNKEHIDWFIDKILWLLVINLIYGVIQVSGYEFIFSGSETLVGYGAIIYSNGLQQYAPIGFMALTSAMACFIAICIPLLLSRKGIMALVSSGMLFIPLYYLHCASAFIASIVGALFVIWYRCSRKVFYIILAICLIGSLGFGMHKMTMGKGGSERFQMWRVATSDAIIHPLVGFGLDSFRNITKEKNFTYAMGGDKVEGRIYVNTWDNPHNLYVSLAYEFGIVIAFILLGGYIRELYKRFKYSIQSKNTIALASVIIGFFIMSIGQFPMFLTRLAVILIPLFSLYEVSTQN